LGASGSEHGRIQREHKRTEASSSLEITEVGSLSVGAITAPELPAVESCRIFETPVLPAGVVMILGEQRKRLTTNGSAESGRG
jgi:hypothetical protein